MKPVTKAWLIRAEEDLDDAARFEEFADHVHAMVLSMLA